MDELSEARQEILLATENTKRQEARAILAEVELDVLRDALADALFVLERYWMDFDLSQRTMGKHHALIEKLKRDRAVQRAREA